MKSTQGFFKVSWFVVTLTARSNPSKLKGDVATISQGSNGLNSLPLALTIGNLGDISVCLVHVSTSSV